jgi:DNA-directed RNA polymerase sigma subunit (sigma70/sigma32)
MSFKECSKYCVDNQVSCPIKDCKNWLDYEEDVNCMLIAIEKNGAMTLREIADRLGLSFVRVKQIQDKAASKMIDNCPDLKEIMEHYCVDVPD